VRLVHYLGTVSTVSHIAMVMAIEPNLETVETVLSCVR
jgi:hypothetical protein